MAIQAGRRLGPYELVSKIGAGGMGEVWKASDRRLERAVAIKILPAEFAQNAQLRLRFEREAKAISALNHPNICTLHDIGREDTTDFLVMELLEGETLAARVGRGPLSMDEVLRYGIQIASALDRAHRAGIIHRDLKPGNVILTKLGAKLLDFGLAKTTSVSAVSVEPTVLRSGETEQMPLTSEGTILGTFQYMAPEQLEGDQADSRTDIFALGCVLYEMATGARAFDGKSKTSLIAHIVAGEPRPLRELRPLTPRSLEHVISRCLAKDPADRWQSAHDVAEELKWITTSSADAVVSSPRSGRREIVAWSLVATLAVAAGVMSILQRGGKLQPKTPIRLTLPAPADARILPADVLGIAISPDGSRLVFAAFAKDGKRALWVRPLDSPASTRLPETEDASYPFWSPDGRHVAFFADGKLKRIDLTGGSPQVICNAPSGRGGSWGPEGTIVLVPELYSGLYTVSSSGGPLKLLVPGDQTMTNRWPHLLPDGKHVIYTSRGRTAGAPAEIRVVAIAGGQPKALVSGASGGVYAEPGYLVFTRGESLLAQPFDLTRVELSGEPVAIIPEKVFHFEPKNLSVFAIAGTSKLVYLPTQSIPLQPMWWRADGTALGPAGAAGLIISAALSRDDEKIAVVRREPHSAITDLWIHDVGQQRDLRLTYGSAMVDDPDWSPDGTTILFQQQTTAVADLYVRKISSADAEPLIVSDFWKYGTSWLPDSSGIVFVEQNPKTRYDLWLWSFAHGTREILLQTPFDENFPAVSPDGRWLAYQSNESGNSNVYIRPLRGKAAPTKVSVHGGLRPRWGRSGGELIFTAPDGQVMAAEILPRTSAIHVGNVRRLFQLPEGGEVHGVSSDGRFLVTVPTEAPASGAFQVVLDWDSLLARRTLR